MPWRRWVSTTIWLVILVVSCASSFDTDVHHFSASNVARYSLTDDVGIDSLGRHPPDVGHHPPGVGHHPPGVGHHPPGVGHHPPGVGHHPPGVGHHPPGVGHHPPKPKERHLARAYDALQSWKRFITSDPKNITGNWIGANVCDYTGIFCSPSIGDSSVRVVSGIDLNHANVGGQLPEELGKLRELGIIHLNSNQFTGGLPQSLKNLSLLTELDLSNNKLSGTFPTVTLQMPNLIYLDLRFNEFHGSIPAEIFNMGLDALFLNNNRFESVIPETFGNSPVSVVVLANNKFVGNIPRSIGNMSQTLNEVIFLNNVFSGPIPSEIGSLHQAEVFDASFNKLSSSLPSSISNMASLVEFNVRDNRLSGTVTDSVCGLPNIKNITLSNNYFIAASDTCTNRPGVTVTIGGNCLSNKGNQRSGSDCRSFYAPPPAPSRTPPIVYPPPSRTPPPSRKSPPPPLVYPPTLPSPPAAQPPPQAPPPVPRAPAPFIPRPPSSPPKCPPGFKTSAKSGRCLLLVTEQKNWTDAESHCQQHGGHLAAVASLDELDDVANMCSQAPLNQTLTDPYSPRGQGCFIGGNKSFDSKWTWPMSPCIPFNDSYWNFLEPNDLNGRENCTSVKYEPPILRASASSPPYMLNDLFCDLLLPFVCSTSRC